MSMEFRVIAPRFVHPSAVINVRHGFIGPGALISEGVRIEGERVEIGRDAFFDRFAVIGGGSCFDPGAFMKAGDFLHVGWNAQINIARGVEIGHEFGCGMESKIFTHGAYIDSWRLGAPVQWDGVKIGDSVWLPNAWVNPGVSIGDNVVVAARSLVNRDIPSGAMAGGTPAKVLKENYLPRVMSDDEKEGLLRSICRDALLRLAAEHPEEHQRTATEVTSSVISCSSGGDTSFDVGNRVIHGVVTPASRLIQDQLRRNGIRFRFEEAEGRWIPWSGNWRTSA